MKTVLITGAAGGIGTRLRSLMKGMYGELRLSDRVRPADLRNDESFVQGELGDLAAVEKMVEGVDGIVHLGGVSVERPWDEIHPANIVGCYNLFEAARRKGVQRVIFASSNHTIGFYPRTRRIGTDVTLRPDGYYGVSKAFGEAIGALYAYKHGMRVTCLRIGNFGRSARLAPPLDLAEAGRPGAAHPHRARSSRPALRGVLRRLRQRARLVGQFGRLPIRVSPDGQVGGVPRAGDGRAGEAGRRSGRRLVPGRRLLQRRLHGTDRRAGALLTAPTRQELPPAIFRPHLPPHKIGRAHV
jgi:uronate dehydrogenase